jgi:hypothetical protein
LDYKGEAWSVLEGAAFILKEVEELQRIGDEKMPMMIRVVSHPFIPPASLASYV